MPKIVDPDQRRTAVICACTRQIAKGGLANVTLRSVARAGGWTTGMVNHYFADKDDLLRATYKARADRARSFLDGLVANGATLLEAAVETGLPVDDDRALDWRVFLAYMGEALGDRHLAGLHQRRTARFLATLTGAIEVEQAAGRFSAAADASAEAGTLLAVLDGIAVLAAFDRRGWPPDRQRRVVAEHLAARMGGPRATIRTARSSAGRAP